MWWKKTIFGLKWDKKGSSFSFHVNCWHMFMWMLVLQSSRQRAADALQSVINSERNLVVLGRNVQKWSIAGLREALRSHQTFHVLTQQTSELRDQYEPLHGPDTWTTWLTRTGRPPPGTPHRSHQHPSGSHQPPVQPGLCRPGSAASRKTPPEDDTVSTLLTGC